MYDFISKEILNPETVPERVEELLSLLIGQQVHIKEVLPNDGTRISDESTLVIMDMVVELEDGSVVNLEVQKSDINFQEQEVHVIQQICCYVNTKKYEVKKERNLIILM